MGPPDVPHAGRRDDTGGVPVGVIAALLRLTGGPEVKAGRRVAAPRCGRGGGVSLTGGGGPDVLRRGGRRGGATCFAVLASA